MRFYKLDLFMWDNDRHVYPSADTTFTCENLAKKYFKGELIDGYNYVDNAPLFDYFSLISISHDDPYDWILNDAHKFSGAFSPVVRGWLVSEFFKLLLEGFSIAPPHRFYDAKVMFQGVKYDYYIFQLAHKHWENIDYEKSEFGIWGREDKQIPVHSYLQTEHKLEKGIFKNHQQYRDFTMKILTENSGQDVKLKTAFLKNYYDIIPEYNSANGILVSERVKIAIEQAQITGVFTELYTQTEFFFADRD